MQHHNKFLLKLLNQHYIELYTTDLFGFKNPLKSLSFKTKYEKYFIFLTRKKNDWQHGWCQSHRKL